MKMMRGCELVIISVAYQSPRNLMGGEVIINLERRVKNLEADKVLVKISASCST